MSRVKYPIGQQDFKTLRDNGCVYVDKTQFIEKIVNSGAQCYFLGRPRRFGKSLFLSTLKYFYEGERKLFNGLYIDSTDWDWTYLNYFAKFRAHIIKFLWLRGRSLGAIFGLQAKEHSELCD